MCSWEVLERSNYGGSLNQQHESGIDLNIAIASRKPKKRFEVGCVFSFADQSVMKTLVAGI